jgi:putative flippase GtrA
MKDWKPTDYIVSFLAFVIGVFALFSVMGVLFTGIPLTDSKAKLVASIVTSIISIVSMYIGSKLHDKKEKEENKN